MSLFDLIDPIETAKRRLLAGIGLAALVMVLGLAVWGARVDHLRAGWKTSYETLHGQAETVRIALRAAACDDGKACPPLAWRDAAGQAVALGETRRELEGAIAAQNRHVDEMAQEAVRLRAQASELKAIADRAQAQRRAALARLSDMAITPGTRADCMTLLKEANAALDTVYEAGL